MSGNENGVFASSNSQTPRAAKSPTVAIIIPTKNRPVLLEEAIRSGLNQSRPPTEIIVVDDGSVPAIDGESLKGKYGPLVHVIRNEESRGLAYSRNLGVEASSSDYVVHLDDDDLLAPDAIAQCLVALHDFSDVDLVFFAVEGFGPNAAHFNRVQQDGVRRVILLGRGQDIRSHIVLFDRSLFPVLLRTVPMAFQRVMLEKSMWQKISQLRWSVYCLDPSIGDEATAKFRINGPLRDSEWARYAAVVCDRMALVNLPLYYQRCEGQGYSSQPANREQHRHQGIEMNKYLLRGAEALPELAQWKSEIRERLAQSYFDAAYHNYQIGNRRFAWRHLAEAATIKWNIGQLRLALRLCLPGRSVPKLH